MANTSNVPAVLEPVRRTFHAAAEAILPATSRFSSAEWSDAERIIESALETRPALVRRQIQVLLRLIEWLPLARFGRRFSKLSVDRRLRVLSAIQDAPLLPLRRGVWGVRTLVFMGHYARPEAAATIGYRAQAGGWRAASGLAPQVDLPAVAPSKEVGPLPPRVYA